MNIKEFSKQLCGRLKGYLGNDYRITAERLDNGKGEMTWQVLIGKKSESLTVNMGIEDCFNQFHEGNTSLNDVIVSILNSYNQVEKRADQCRNLCFSLETAKENIYYRLVNWDRNKQMLEKLAHIRVLDFAVIFSVIIHKTEEGVTSTPVTNEMRKRWKCSVECLYQLAEENTIRLFPMIEESVAEAVSRYLNISTEEVLLQEGEKTGMRDLTVISNEINCHGAAVLLYPNVLQNIAERFQDNLVIFPSSIHEVLLLPYAQIKEGEGLNQMVRDINKEHLKEKEILSDHIYLYDKDTHTLISGESNSETWEVPV